MLRRKILHVYKGNKICKDIIKIIGRKGETNEKENIVNDSSNFINVDNTTNANSNMGK